jgi:hypothetical protein
MDKKIIFELFKNIIISNNKILLKDIAKETGLDEQYLIDKYLQPAYYLPIVLKPPS